MADATNQPVSPSDSGAPEPGSKSGGYLSTSTGKIVVGAIALFVLLAIAGAIALMVALGGVSGFLKSGSSATDATTVTPVTTSTPAAAEAPIVTPEEKPLSSSFTFRNVFAPSIKAPLSPSAEASAASTAGSTDSPDTLYLTDIVTDDEGRHGVFVWNGVSYTAGKGEIIGSTPWKVLEVSQDSVLMLYGDTQVTLTLGQGLQK